jgi:hypothetical protein
MVPFTIHLSLLTIAAPWVPEPGGSGYAISALGVPEPGGSGYIDGSLVTVRLRRRPFPPMTEAIPLSPTQPKAIDSEFSDFFG